MRGLGQDDTAFPFAVVFTLVGLCIALAWIIAGSGFDPAAAAPEIDGAVVFIGSSTIDRFPLAEHFPGKRVANLGRGNETAPDLRERLKRVFPAAANPAGIVLYAGSADLRFDPGLPASAIRERVEALLDLLRSRAPGTPVAMLEVLPARGQSAEERASLDALNRELAALAGERGHAFVRTNRPPLAGERGDLLESVSVDRHHLNEDGYRALAAWIREEGGAVGERLR